MTWINTPLAAINLEQVCRISFRYMDERHDVIDSFVLHMADGTVVPLDYTDPGFDEISIMLTEEGFTMTTRAALPDPPPPPASRKTRRYFVMNDTDGVFAHPDPMTSKEAERFMVQFLKRFERQGFYSSVRGRIPLSELKLSLRQAE